MINFKIEVKGMDRLNSKINNICSGLKEASEQGTLKGAEAISKLAISFAPGAVKGEIKVELCEEGNLENAVAARVFNSTSRHEWTSYVEFGTGLFVDDQGNPDAIRLKVSTQIPWYIHVDMVPENFARFGYPKVVGRNGQLFWEVVGSHPQPYMQPAAFSGRDKAVEEVTKAISNMLMKEGK